MTRVIVVGQEVADKIKALRAQAVLPSAKVPGCFDSGTLVAFQRQMSNAGYIEAEIVESNYGFSVRYASGLQNFALIHASRGQPDRSFEFALAVAKRWQEQDPTRRYVSTSHRYTEVVS